MGYVKDLTHLLVSSTFQRLLQISGSNNVVLDGTGSLVTGTLNVTASYADTASYAVSASHEIIKEVSSSYADTASFAQSGEGIFLGSFSGSFSGSYEGIFDGIDLQNFSSSVQNRITINETNIDNLEIDSGSFSTRITTNEFDIDTLESASSSFASDIINLQFDSASFSIRVTTNEGDINDLETASSSFSSDIINLQSDSSSFSTRITTNEFDILNLQSDSSSFSTRITNEETTSSTLINDYTYVQSLGTNDDVEFNSISINQMTFSTILVSGSYNLTPNYYYIDIDTTTYSCSIQLFDASDVDNGWTCNIGDISFSASVNGVTLIASGSQKVNNAKSASFDGDGNAFTIKSNGVDQFFIR